MLTPDLSRLEVHDVDKLRGLILNVAFALYVEGWKWIPSNSPSVRKILWDEDVPANERINMSACRYMGDGLFVYSNLPEYDKNISYLIDKANSFNQRQRNLFVFFLKETIGSEKRFPIANASALSRARSIVKVFVHLNKENRERNKK